MKYIVKSGDTMYKIAIRYGITLDELIKANPEIENPNLIMVGQEINIPVSKPSGGPPVTLPDVTPCPELPLDNGEIPVEEPPFVPVPGGICPGGGGMDYGTMPGMDYGTMPGMDYGTMPGMDYGMMPGMDYGMMPGMDYGMMPGMDYGMMPDMGHDMMPGECGCYYAMQQGDKGYHVKCLQERLKQMGYYKGACNGRFGSITKGAVERYQRACGMEESGIVDLFVLKALGLY